MGALKAPTSSAARMKAGSVARHVRVETNQHGYLSTGEGVEEGGTLELRWQHLARQRIVRGTSASRTRRSLASAADKSCQGPTFTARAVHKL